MRCSYPNQLELERNPLMLSKIIINIQTTVLLGLTNLLLAQNSLIMRIRHPQEAKPGEPNRPTDLKSVGISNSIDLRKFFTIYSP